MAHSVLISENMDKVEKAEAEKFVEYKVDAGLLSLFSFCARGRCFL